MQTSNVILCETTKLSGEWVGSILKDDQEEFIRISFTEQWCDLPQRKQFNLSIFVTEADNAFTVSDSFYFAIERNDRAQGLNGNVNQISNFCLWPVAKADTAPNQTVGGSYQLNNGREFFIAAEAGIHWPVWQLYYHEGDNLVRLYPIGEENYLSELCELFTFSGNKLSVRSAHGEQNTGLRITLYTEESLEIAVETGYKLAGSLLTPLQPGPHPLVILIHGAGPGLRGDYLMVADIFARQGIAVFVYDKRGWGKSTGEPMWSDIFKLADDAEAVIRQVRQHPKVDAKRMGLWGFSNGGWVAPLAASRCHDIAFIISFSGSGVPPARQEQIRRCTVAKEVLGASADQVALLERFWGEVFRFGATGEWTTALENVIDTVENDLGLQALPKHEGYPEQLQPVPPRRTRAEWLEFGGQDAQMALDPVPIFRELPSPILFVWGEQDSVVPAEESRRAIVNGLQNRDNYAILMAPNAGHGSPFCPGLRGRLAPQASSCPLISRWGFRSNGCWDYYRAQPPKHWCVIVLSIWGSHCPLCLFPNAALHRCVS
ncbi:MAG: alpha/beta fold hydrolase [Caldilineaceae bacterium]